MFVIDDMNMNSITSDNVASNEINAPSLFIKSPIINQLNIMTLNKGYLMSLKFLT